MIFRFLFHLGAWLLGYSSGDAARRRSQARRAVNPARETAWTLAKVAFGFGLMAWLFGLGGMHAISVALQALL